MREAEAENYTFIASGVGYLDIHVYCVVWYVDACILMTVIGVLGLLAEGNRFIYTWSHDVPEPVSLRDLGFELHAIRGRRGSVGVRLTYGRRPRLLSLAESGQ